MSSSTRRAGRPGPALPAIRLSLPALGLVFFTRISVDGTYLRDPLPGFLLIGVGGGFWFVPVSIAALSGVTGREAALASGLINTSQQVGGALGLAIRTTVATTRTEHLVAQGNDPLTALTGGFSLAFWVGALVAVIALVTTLVMLDRRDLRPSVVTEIELGDRAGSESRGGVRPGTRPNRG